MTKNNSQSKSKCCDKCKWMCASSCPACGYYCTCGNKWLCPCHSPQSVSDRPPYQWDDEAKEAAKIVNDIREANSQSVSGWEEEFEKEVIDYFWNKKNVVGTQRLSLNHIDKIKSFISSTLQKQREDIIKVVGEYKLPEQKLSEWTSGYNIAISDIINELKNIK